MKKQILLFAFTILATYAFAQTKPGFGFRAGVSSSRLSGDAVNSLQNLLDYTNGAITSSNNTGLFAGAHLSIPVSDVVSIEPGLFYTQKGYEMKGELNLKGAEFLGLNAKAKLNSHYIDLPVLLKVNIDGFQIFAGPQVSYLAKADLRTTAGVLGFNLLNKTLDATDQFNRWDAGVTGGIGYELSNGVNFTASYDHGLSKVDANQNLESYNRGFKVGLGIKF
ncbi:MAG: porin family protein [Flavisolibacter sp.]